MLTNKDISVVISTYNAAITITNSLDSIVRQTMVPAEIVIIDDGSTDNTKEVVLNYDTGGLTQISYYYQDNAGCGLAKNYGIKNARNSWISFLDADDIWVPSKIERHISLLNQYPEVRIVSSNYYINDTEQTGISPADMSVIQEDGIVIADYITMLVNGIYALPSAVVAEKAFLEEAGMFARYRAGDDTDLWCRIGLMGSPVMYDNVPLVKYSQDSYKNFSRKMDVVERIGQINSLYRLSIEKGKEQVFFPALRILVEQAILQLEFQKRYSDIIMLLDGVGLVPFPVRFILEEKLKAKYPTIFCRAFSAYHRVKKLIRRK